MASNLIPNNALTTATKTLTDQIVLSLKNIDLDVTDEQRQNLLTAIQYMYRVCKSNGISFNDTDKASITDVLEKICVLNLNCSAIPSECFLELRKQYAVSNDESGKKTTDYSHFVYIWNVGVQGAGNEKLVRKYGVNVKQVYQPWIVREHDEFKYPHFKGLQIEAPEWTPKGTGKAIRIVYPIEMLDGTIQYLISEREDVKANLIAHIRNNLIGKANEKLRDDIVSKCENMSLDEILDNREICTSAKVSSSWTSMSSREQMIITKMKNNALKTFPKDFSNQFIASEYKNSSDETPSNAATDVEIIDATTKVETHAPENTKQFLEAKANKIHRAVPEGFGDDDVKQAVESTKKVDVVTAIKSRSVEANKVRKEKEAEEVVDDDPLNGLPF